MLLPSLSPSPRARRFPLLAGLLTLLAPSIAAGQCGQTLVGATPGDLGDGYAESFDVDGSWAIVSARLDDQVGPDAGAAWILHDGGSSWGTDAVLLPEEGALFSHAQVAIEYPWAFAGSLWEPNPDGSSGRGVVRIYRHDELAGAWNLTQRLWLPNGGSTSSFGGQVEVQDGLLMVSARGLQELHAFRLENDQWTAAQVLTDPDPGLGGDWLGLSIAAEYGDLATAVVRPGTGLVAYRFDADPDGPAGQVLGLAERIDFGSGDLQAGEVALGRYGIAVQGLTSAAGESVVHVQHRPAIGPDVHETLPAPDGLSAEFGRALAYTADDATLFVGSRAFAGAVGPLGLGLIYRRGGGGLRLESEFRPFPIYPELRFATAARSRGEELLVATKDAWGGAGLISGQLFAFDPLPSASLVPSDEEVSVTAGGSQALAIQACPELAGHFYVVIGSLGLLPQGGYVQIGPHSVALDPDAWMQASLELANLPPFLGTFGTLDAAGHASAAIAVPPGSDNSLVGLRLYHEAVSFDPVTVAVSSTSIPVELLLGL